MQQKKKLIKQMQTQHRIIDRKVKNKEWITSNLSRFPLLSSVHENLINEICFSFPLLYTLIRRMSHKKILRLQAEGSYDILTRELQKEYLVEILEFFDTNLGSMNIGKLNKKEMFSLMCDLIRRKCCLENFFIQDIFDPRSIFKEKYKSDSFTSLFMTAFYYILNCEFRSTGFPLQLNHNKQKFRFPMDVSPNEFERPCVIVDVANQLNRIGDYQSRVRYLKTNIFTILDKLIKKHPEPNLLVFFVHQGDRSKQYNCPEIIHIFDWRDDVMIRTLLNGTPTKPFDRQIFYMTIPCHLFLAPELAYPGSTRVVRRDFAFNLGNEPGYPGGGGYAQRVEYKKTDPPIGYLQEVKNIFYDRYGRILYLPEHGNIDSGTKSQPHRFMSHYGRHESKSSKIPYYDYIVLDEKIPNLPRPPFKTDRKSIPYSVRHARDATTTSQGQNRFQNYIKPVNECSGHTIHKNEIDDYMIGILLYVRYKVCKECKDFAPFRARWLIFTHDNYRWMNQDVFDSRYILKKDDFLSYIDDPNPTHKNSLFIPNPISKRLVQELGLYRHKSSLYQFFDLLQSVIHINRI